MADERTEQPTPRRLEEARKRGEIPKSPEVTGAVGLLMGMLALQWAGGHVVGGIQDVMRASFMQLGTLELSETEVYRLALAAAGAMLGILLPVFGAVLFSGLASNLAQTRGLVTVHPLRPDLNRINPANHLRQLFSGRTLFELAKALLKVTIVGVVAYRAFSGRYQQLVVLTGADLQSALAVTVQVIVDVAMQATIAYVVLAVADYLYQRRAYLKRMRMTKQEVREDLKQSEGNPEVKSKQRAQARRLSRARMMANVPQADVVITNPTHYAVALAYDSITMRAPKVLAKGTDLVALRIREIAQSHGVPIVENPPLAQSLYKLVEVDSEIPVQLFEAVAEVLAFVYALRQRRRASLN